MRRLLLLSASAMMAIVLLLPVATKAQLPGPGNIDWQEVWANYPPPSPDPSNPNYWMYGNRTYTGLAYDQVNDVIYIVNPATCSVGSLQFKCQRIWAWDAETGVTATRIDPPSAPAGQLYVNSNLISGSFSRGQYAIFKIDVDDQGRIYAANAVAPIFGVCYPGPPPNCDPDYLSQGPYKVYRWNTPNSNPILLYQTVGTGPNDTEMTWTMWGTSFAVTGKEHQVGEETHDSARVFCSGGKFYSGFTTVNDEVACFAADFRQNPPTPFRYAIDMKHNQAQSGFAAHGIAPTGPYIESQIYTDANFREVVLNNQQQTNDPMPQLYTMSLNQALPSSVTGNSGPIAYFLDTRWNRPYLICADGLPSSTQFGDPNYNTTARVVDLATGPNWENWPAGKTPAIGNTLYNNFTGIDNWITDIDYKIWVNDIPGDSLEGQPYLQLFVLMSNNGIASFRTRNPLPTPVEMTTFRGLIDGNDVALTWQIASETNNRGFEVYRSFNGGDDWEQIGFVNGRGNATNPAEYSFRDPITDVHENLGTVKYRLKQVDFDGSYEWTNAVDVFINASPTDMVLYQNYPNPFNPSTKISFQLTEPAYVTLKVFNTLGDEVVTLVNESKDAGLHNVEFDASGLSSGTYMYQINANGQISQKKMVLTK